MAEDLPRPSLPVSEQQQDVPEGEVAAELPRTSLPVSDHEEPDHSYMAEDLPEGEVAAELPRSSLPVSDQEEPVSQPAEVPSAYGGGAPSEPWQDPQHAAAVP